MPPRIDTTVYVATGCLSCARFLEAFRRLSLPNVRVIDLAIDAVSVPPSLTAVPAVVERGAVPLMGTDAFVWMQTHEASLPLEAYAMTLGSGTAGMASTDITTDSSFDADPFSDF